MKKQIISLLMAFVMSLTLLPTISYAAEESGCIKQELDDEVMLVAEGQHSHCICGASHKDIGKHKGEVPVSFDKKLSCSSSDSWLQVDNNSAGKTTIDNRTYWVLPAGSYYLAGDITLDKSILIESGEVNICLNGHELRLNHGTVQIWEVIQLNGGTLNLTDCQDKGTVCHVDDNPGRGVTVGNGTSFTLYGGTICNNVARVSSTEAQGGGVYIGTRSTFNMYGGKIHNNRAEDSNEPTYEAVAFTVPQREHLTCLPAR